MNDDEKVLGVLARELYPDLTNVVFVYSHPDDLPSPWQPVDARLGRYGVSGANLIEGTLFLRRKRRPTVRRRLWIGWMWLRLGLWRYRVNGQRRPRVP